MRYGHRNLASDGKLTNPCNANTARGAMIRRLCPATCGICPLSPSANAAAARVAAKTGRAAATASTAAAVTRR